jgi:hypothetical protein
MRIVDLCDAVMEGGPFSNLLLLLYHNAAYDVFAIVGFF